MLKFYFIIIVFFVNSCGNFEDTKVIREVNGTFSDDKTEALIVESHYYTSTPNNPYYYDPNAHDYEVYIYRADLKLSNRNLLINWKEEYYDKSLGTTVKISSGGNIQYHPIYWLKAKKRLIGLNFERKGPFIVELDTGVRHLLVYEQSFFSNLLPTNELFLVNNMNGTCIAPSPDGLITAVMYSASYIKNKFDLYFRYILAIYDTETASFIDAARVNASNNETGIDITPYYPNNYKYEFLWSKDSQGIFVPYSSQEAFYYKITNNKLIEIKTNMVPKYSVITYANEVCTNSNMIKLVERYNRTNIELVFQTNYIDFYDIPLELLENINYIF